MELKPLPERGEKELIPAIQHALEEKNMYLKERGLPTVNITNELVSQNAFQQIAWEKESTKQAFGVWKNSDVRQMLDLYGLPRDSSLSVLCVEVFGHITNAFEHIDNFRNNAQKLVDKTAVVFNENVAEQLSRNVLDVNNPPAKSPIDPLKSQLGLFRILRTSPLVEVPFICKT
jgi:hypothetical protein